MQYFIRFWSKVFRLAAYIIRSRKKETQAAYQKLESIEKQFGGVFQPATRKKIAVSYGIYNPMLCDAFTRLHGRLTNQEEKDRLKHYFVCSSLFDDFTDHDTITEEQLYRISFEKESYIPQSFDEKAFLQSHSLLRDFVKDKASYDRVSHDLYDAQQFSRLQYNSKLPDEEIKEVTFRKGGNSVLLCSFYMDFEATSIEEACWYKIGSIIQLTNDLYDIYKDGKDNIATLSNRMTNAYAFEQFFQKQVDELLDLVRQLPFPINRKRTFAISLAGICSFGFIAIGQLKKIQGNALTLPSFESLPRKALIVDMEKLSNLAKWFKYTYRYGRL